jgi:nitrogen fixation/metabolism regulation signal transduction histidine kinase
MLVVGGAVTGIILMFVLTSASENSGFFERHYPWLLGLNALVAVTLFGLVILLLARLYSRFRSGQFGSKLMMRLVLLFALVGILPGAVIYVVSVQFVSSSIESWFDVRIETALDSGVKLVQTALDASLAELSAKARNIALELSGQPLPAQNAVLLRLAQQIQFQEAVVLGADGRSLISASAAGTAGAAGTQAAAFKTDVPTSVMLGEARLGRGFAIIEGGAEPQEVSPKSTRVPEPTPVTASLRLRVIVAIPGARNGPAAPNELRYLQLLQPVPDNLATNGEVLRLAYSQYNSRLLARSGLRKIFIVTLTLTLLLSIFGAIASAFLIASNLAKPLLLLAEGTRAVAAGDLSPRPIVASADEFGILTQSFNTMTRQLLDARTSVEKNRAALEHAKARLESVLANMSAGVMVLDSAFKLVTFNQSVERILQHGFDQHLGQALATIDGMSPFVDAITKAFSEQSAQSAAAGASLGNNLHWQQQIEIPRNIGGTHTDHDITLLTRGSRLPVENGTGFILVFDDISDVISAERSIAWGEVARRLAHEIKNPLTPIQLSAERLQMRLQDKLTKPDLDLLNKGTATIVNQVSAMKRMVDDFRDYAKTPPAVLLPLDLNGLIAEILNLYIAGDERDIVHARLDPALPLVMGDATQLRQVIHNLLQNAQDATVDHHKAVAAASGVATPGVATSGVATPRIDVTTEAIHYCNANGEVLTAVRLAVEDNGPGFAPNILARAFEPYVTSKSRGTGLGLAMVKKIVDEHGGRIDIHNRTDASGAQILILLLKLAPS